MIRLLLLVCAVCKAQGHYAPLIFAAPSAVSHQSRIDIRYNPGYVSAPLVYSPLAIYPSPAEAASDSIFTPVIKADQLLTPVALTFFHNLPLARALERPVSIDKIQEEANLNNAANEASIKNEDESTEEAVTSHEEKSGRNYDSVLVYKGKV